MNKMDLIRQNMAKRQERTLDALADNKIRSTGASVLPSFSPTETKFSW